MGTQKFFPSSMLKSHFTHVDTGYLMEFVYRAMFWVVNSFWVLVSNFLLFLFGFLDRYLHRLEADEIYPKDDCSWKVDNFRGEDEVVVVESDGCGGREKFEYFSGFKFQQMENSQVPNTSKYQVNSRKDFRGFMEEPEHVSFTVQELFVGSNDDPDRENGIGENQENYQKGEKFIVDLNDFSKENDQTLDPVLGGEDFSGLNLEVESVILGKTEDSVQSFCGETVPEKLEEAIFRGNNFLGDKEMENCHMGPIDFFGGFEFSPSTSDGDDLNSENCIPVDEEKLDFDEKIPKTEGTSMNYSKKFDEDEDTDDEYIELDPNLQFSIGNPENLKMKGAEKIDTCVETEELSSQKKLRESDDDEDDILLKHQDLIEQMKMEMKNARNKGLPTILEEFETPKMAEDLKPLKIDEKLEHKDRMEEIHKVYKSYVEKMRKLDILNYQTLHAISFLQFKDPTQSDSCHKSSSLAFKSLLLPFLWPCKLRRIYAADPSLKSIREMHRNLEMVYVGQLCLSWEILHWEFEKVKELLEHDSEGPRSYNLVAGDFQQFQVLVLRFVENEQFQGPRVQMYAKNRCDLGAFLQVPAIKEDCLKEKKESSIEGENVVSIANLGEIIDESMHAFSEFLCADKDNTVSTLKGLLTTYVDLQDPSDSELLMEIKTSLRKKDKRLKDILRSGNCIVKKFQKQEEGRTDRDQLFAQVELKLVSRVLKMSKLTTDQLIWCQKKLNKINFINRKVNVEPSFLLFPF